MTWTPSGQRGGRDVARAVCDALSVRGGRMDETARVQACRVSAALGSH